VIVNTGLGKQYAAKASLPRRNLDRRSEEGTYLGLAPSKKLTIETSDRLLRQIKSMAPKGGGQGTHWKKRQKSRWRKSLSSGATRRDRTAREESERWKHCVKTSESSKINAASARSVGNQA